MNESALRATADWLRRMSVSTSGLVSENYANAAREVIEAADVLGSLRAKAGEWRTSAVMARANADNDRIPPMDRRQCFGVSQAYEQCAEDLSALLVDEGATTDARFTPVDEHQVIGSATHSSARKR